MNTNSEAMRALLSTRFADVDAAFAAIEAIGAKKDDYKAVSDQGEYILAFIGKLPESNPGPDAPAKPQGKAKAPAKAKGKGKAKADPAPAPKADSKPQGKKGADARIAAQGDLKAKGKAKEAKGEKGVQSKWRPLADRKWIGVWAEWKEKAEKGILPDVGSSKLNKLEQRSAKFYGFNSAGSPYFAADTHKSWEKKLHALCALIRAKDLKGLKAFEVEEKSSTRDAIAKMRDLAIGALMAKEAKPAKNGKAKEAPADAPAEMPAQE